MRISLLSGVAWLACEFLVFGHPLDTRRAIGDLNQNSFRTDWTSLLTPDTSFETAYTFIPGPGAPDSSIASQFAPSTSPVPPSHPGALANGFASSFIEVTPSAYSKIESPSSLGTLDKSSVENIYSQEATLSSAPPALGETQIPPSDWIQPLGSGETPFSLSGGTQSPELGGTPSPLPRRFPIPGLSGTQSPGPGGTLPQN